MFIGITMPFILIIIERKLALKRFYTIPNGKKLIDFSTPEDLTKFLDKTIGETDPPAVVVAAEMPEIFWDFLCNWLNFYLKNERLKLYIIPYSDPCSDPSLITEANRVLCCIPIEQLDLGKEKGRMFRCECDVMGTAPLSYFWGDPSAEFEFSSEI